MISKKNKLILDKMKKKYSKKKKYDNGGQLFDNNTFIEAFNNNNLLTGLLDQVNGLENPIGGNIGSLMQLFSNQLISPSTPRAEDNITLSRGFHGFQQGGQILNPLVKNLIFERLSKQVMEPGVSAEGVLSGAIQKGNNLQYIKRDIKQNPLAKRTVEFANATADGTPLKELKRLADEAGVPVKGTSLQDYRNAARDQMKRLSTLLAITGQQEFGNDYKSPLSYSDYIVSKNEAGGFVNEDFEDEIEMEREYPKKDPVKSNLSPATKRKMKSLLKKAAQKRNEEKNNRIEEIRKEKVSLLEDSMLKIADLNVINPGEILPKAGKEKLSFMKKGGLLKRQKGGEVPMLSPILPNVKDADILKELGLIDDNTYRALKNIKQDTISYRTNNPLNITDSVKEAIGFEQPVDGDAPIAKFPNIATGLAAVYRKFNNHLKGKSKWAKPNMTIKDYQETYATSPDAFNTFRVTAKNQGYEINPKDSLEKVMSTMGMDNFVKAMMQKENNDVYKELTQPGLNIFNKINYNNYQDFLKKDGGFQQGGQINSQLNPLEEQDPEGNFLTPGQASTYSPLLMSDAQMREKLLEAMQQNNSVQPNSPQQVLKKGGSTLKDNLSAKIKRLILEGYPKKQAIAIAYNMMKDKKMEMGGETLPISPLGQYAFPSQESIVPSRNLTFEGINNPTIVTPIEGIDAVRETPITENMGVLLFDIIPTSEIDKKVKSRKKKVKDGYFTVGPKRKLSSIVKNK